MAEGRTRDVAGRLRDLSRLVPAMTAGDNGPSPDAAVGPEAFGAERVAHPRGEYWLRRTRHPLGEPWGDARMDDASFCAEGLQTLPFWTSPPVGPERWAFVDCETTGLSSGAGTVAFLVAVGYPAGEDFVIDQYFLPDVSDECGMLTDLGEALACFELLWTYNGASFDLPLLEGRFNFWRLDPAFRSLPHNDLLHASRALFRRRIGECTLGNIERRILRTSRVEDLPGSEVPGVYFEFLRSGVSPRLFSVFEHNRIDVLTLGAYVAYLIRMLGNDAAERQPPVKRYPEDFLSLAWYLLRRREGERALAALDVADAFVLTPPWRGESSRARALALKQLRCYGEADRAWGGVRGPVGDAARIEALIERAKHREHRMRDFAGALRHVRSAEVICDLDWQTGRRQVPGRLRADLAHRRRRLRRRLDKV